MILSKDQEKALSALHRWYDLKSKAQTITLGGYAGTGKTTLIAHFRTNLKKVYPKLNVAFCSFTGKATMVLKLKLIEHKAMFSGDTISTIHGLIYSPIEDSLGQIVGWQRKETIKAELIIVDEASMVDEQIWRHLLAYKVPIIAVGDHGQLPPINGSFNLMQTPQLKLEEIHRQAKGNPIIDISIAAREFGQIDCKSYGPRVSKHSKSDPDTPELVQSLLESYTTSTLILCGYNTTRNKINTVIRRTLDFESPSPTVGDRVICLRNNHEKKIYNGMLGTISTIFPEKQDWYSVEIKMDEPEYMYKGLIYAPQFGNTTGINFTQDRKLAHRGDLFDFGYALTVHKAQGSQAKKVILFEERFKQMDDALWKRWLYTAVTRAEEELVIIG